MTTPKSTPSPEVVSLVTRLFPRLRRFFSSKTRGADEAQDLAQATIAVLLERDTDELEETERYLWGIANNKLKQHYERLARGQRLDMAIASVEHISTTLGTKLDRKTRISDAMRRLPMHHQTAIELRYGEGLKLEEVAEATGRSLASIKRDIKSGLDAMRVALGTADGDEDLGLQVGADYRRS